MHCIVTVNTNPLRLGIEFEAGSVAEARTMLIEQKSALEGLVADFAILTGASEGHGESDEPHVPGVAKRTRRTKAQIAADEAAAKANPPVPVAPLTPPVITSAPPIAVAPPPMPIPTNTLSPPPPATPSAPGDTGGIPTFLARAPAPPPAFVPTAPSDIGRGAQEIIVELKRRAEGAADKGQALADWLADWGLLTKGATFAEACAVLPFSKNDKLTGIAGQLGVTVPA